MREPGPIGRLFGAVPGGDPLERARLHDGQERALDAVQRARAALEQSAALVARQRSALDAAVEHARLIGSHGRDFASTSRQGREALERIRLLALNAALEASRLGEGVGRALGAVADEVRSHAGRGLDALDQLEHVLASAEEERQRLEGEVAEARGRASGLGEDLARGQAALAEVATAMEALSGELGRQAGTDPVTARLMVEATEHAQRLAEVLGRLVAGGQRAAVLRVLMPSLMPLVRLVQRERP